MAIGIFFGGGRLEAKAFLALALTQFCESTQK